MQQQVNKQSNKSLTSKYTHETKLKHCNKSLTIKINER